MTTIPVNPNAVIKINNFQDWGDNFALDGNGGYPASYSFDLSGWTYFTINDGSPEGFGETVVNLAANSYWIGGLGIGYAGEGAVVEGQGVMFNTNSHIDNIAYIGVPVDGNGSWTVDEAHSVAKLEFIKSVGYGQSVDVEGDAGYGGEYGTLQVDDPSQFHASVKLGFGEVILKAVEATSYSLKNDLLTLYNGAGRVADRVRLAISTAIPEQNGPVGFGVSQTAAGVIVHADTSSWGARDWASGTALTVHT